MTNVEIGYQAALQRADTEAAIIWGTFNSMVAVNAITIAVYVGWLTAAGARLPFLPIGLPVFGVVVCLIWLLMLNRQFAYYRYWFACARSLESALEGVQVIQNGKVYADGQEVEILGKVTKEKMQMSRAARSVRVEKLAKFLIVMFMAAYALLLVLFIFSPETISNSGAAGKA
jgi:hypothetical protein